MSGKVWVNVGDILRMYAARTPNKLAALDSSRRLTFSQWNERANRLANAIKGLGIGKGDRVCILAYNCVEWMEIYAAAAKGGFIVVPIMFRLAPPEIKYVINHSGSVAIIYSDEFAGTVDLLSSELPNMKSYIVFGENQCVCDCDESTYRYEGLIANASVDEPQVAIDGKDIWIIMYTGGTTGLPKGVIKTHESLVAQYLVTAYEKGFNEDDIGMVVMPMCHINSVYYGFTFTYLGAACYVYTLKNFDPEHLLKTIADEGITFTSLVPTHYIMILALPEDVKKKYNVDCMRKLLCSSAPCRRDTKLAILDFFKNSRLFEAYGSTEAGIVTILRPHEQLKKIGSIGREVIGTDRIKLLDEDGNEVSAGEVGELYSKGPMMFDGYWNEPEKTKKAFIGDYFSAGDMAYKDGDGFFYLVDRKANMIITGGENVYPSEVENAIGSHLSVKDVAVIGVLHEKWGEQVTAIIVLHQGKSATGKDMTEFCRGKIAGFKIPKELIFIKDEEMPRSGAGKILHRVLRETFGKEMRK
jgi:fatty-acyl-CoA synthase